jgi:hypothetical protein
VKH